MSIIKEYTLIYDDVFFIFTVNIDYTLGLINDVKNAKLNDLYIDGDVCLLLMPGIKLTIGTEQDFGNLLDFLDATQKFRSDRSGLFAKGHTNYNCTFFIERIESFDVLTINFNNRYAIKKTIRLSDVLEKEMFQLKIKILNDMQTIIDLENIEAIKHICEMGIL